MTEQLSKKFVFTVKEDNVSFVEGLSYEKKNDLINKLLKQHRSQTFQTMENKDFFNKVKKTVIIILAILVGIPLSIATINFLYDSTVNSYAQMEKNFERLFDEQNRK